MSGIKRKDPRRQWQGAVNKAQGKQFEERLDAAFAYYARQGSALVEKTPEPMHIVQRLDKGRFVVFPEKPAQPDYKGVLKDGQAVMFEAKFTTTDRLTQDRVTPEQAQTLERYQAMGALCYVLAGFASGAVYRVPWDVWAEMKQRFGRKYIAETDEGLAAYRVPEMRDGTLLILG